MLRINLFCFFSLSLSFSLKSAECPDDAEQEEQKEKPQPSEPSEAANGVTGSRRNPPGGKSSLILGWDHFFPNHIFF